MSWMTGRRLRIGAVAIAAMGTVQSAQAEDFFSSLFNTFSGHRMARSSALLPFASEGEVSFPPKRRVSEPRGNFNANGSRAFCVRTCDGRYFPIAVDAGHSSAGLCNSFCPASETKVVRGNSIDQAITEKGQLYSSLPNADRFRNEIVADCTCNGKDQTGLVPIKIADDPTLRKGDILVGAQGSMIVERNAARRSASPNIRQTFARARDERAPAVALD